MKYRNNHPKTWVSYCNPFWLLTIFLQIFKEKLRYSVKSREKESDFFKNMTEKVSDGFQFLQAMHLLRLQKKSRTMQQITHS